MTYKVSLYSQVSSMPPIQIAIYVSVDIDTLQKPKADKRIKPVEAEGKKQLTELREMGGASGDGQTGGHGQTGGGDKT